MPKNGDRAGNVLRQYVWSHEFIDSLAQIAVNVDLLNNPEMELDPAKVKMPSKVRLPTAS